MRHAFEVRRSRDAQTFVFFALTFGTILLLCGLAIDSGLLFLAKARMGRAVDGASLAAVGNFNASSGISNPSPKQIRIGVANIMRNFAGANYTDLNYAHAHYGIKDFPISPDLLVSDATPETSEQYTTTNGQAAYKYTYNFNDGTKDPNGNFRKYVEVVLTTGTGGQITSATCNARCPVSTYFIGAMAPFFRDLKVSASSVATRNPRLIAIVLDRSASMLAPGGGAYGLPQAVVQFLDFFDTSADYISIVSFGSNARLEMPLTTNFIVAGTNLLFDAYDTNSSGAGVPGTDPEEFSSNTSDFQPNYAYSGVRRFKFGGLTAADDGIRLGMEQLMANSGFNDPDVVKYMVIFTDGSWNQSRTLLAAPPYKNIVLGPPLSSSPTATNTAPWSTNMALNTNLITVPTFSPIPYLTNAIMAKTQAKSGGNFSALAPDHYHDNWQSTDGTNEPIVPVGTSFSRKDGDAMTLIDPGILNTNGSPVYARYIDVWLPPGAVDYEYSNTNSTPIGTYVSDLTNPTNHISIIQQTGWSNVLVMPGYVADGLFFDEMNLCWWDNTCDAIQDYVTFPSYRVDNYQSYFMWPDDNNSVTTSADAAAFGTTILSNSLERQLMFRNYPNLLVGFYITRPDDPAGPAGDIDPYTGAIRPSYGLGPYYPGGGIYWPFDMVGINRDPTFVLTNAATGDPDPMANTSPNGGSRYCGYTINMLSPDATPRWSGEWFYEGIGGTNVISSPGNVSKSVLMSSKAMWQSNAPPWLTTYFDAGGETIMTNETAHNTNVIPSAVVWRPASFSGTYLATIGGGVTAASIVNSHNMAGGSKTGGYVVDGSTGKVYTDSMGYSGRPTHYFDFSQSKWIPVADQHNLDLQALQLGNWKAQEYAWHARAMGVTIFTVGYGYLVTPAQQIMLAQVANATNTTAGNPQSPYMDGPGTAITCNPNQPIGQQYYATNGEQISNDFYQVGQAINAALTQ